MKHTLPNEVLNDIEKIKATLGENLAKISLFGSSSYKSFDEANDIDIAIFIEGASLNEVRDLIVAQELHYPIEGKYINGSYRGPEKSVDKSKKHYDIVVLNHDNTNKRFMEINKEFLIEL
jgi:predicted nucleotidyltransferase